MQAGMAAGVHARAAPGNPPDANQNIPPTPGGQQPPNQPQAQQIPPFGFPPGFPVPGIFPLKMHFLFRSF